MSNHSGSYMLNEVLHLLEERSVFALIGPDEARRLALDVVKLSNRYDCNPGEILDEIGGRLGICRWCYKANADLVDGICLPCRKSDEQS